MTKNAFHSHNLNQNIVQLLVSLIKSISQCVFGEFVIIFQYHQDSPFQIAFVIRLSFRLFFK